mmetsp:Transcript_3474/g.9194  ORF Transcript_3474/g.9194 Transcript_3474/m.9194 type:complete len:568 (-) Transcript_3474:885-2588(-)|eukprot:CAMPEP_0198127286 /NCGR_PEP_ID=MMETSP1442-20131203/46811_1 /TAXON_ID= /ORGANISM="Craspedostauros australis, Strain CCMP3328" /LENGTH=567 /DNA_ID=CAMNT_0043787235 /DNA_START=522 /DNA_END=2225 /DNA_ORIENTATION=+
MTIDTKPPDLRSLEHNPQATSLDDSVGHRKDGRSQSLQDDGDVDQACAIDDLDFLNEKLDTEHTGEHQHVHQQEHQEQHQEQYQEQQQSSASVATDNSSKPSQRQNNKKRTLDGSSASSSRLDDTSIDDDSKPSSSGQPDTELLDAERQQAREISALSLREREDLYEDIHGVRRPVQETEDFRQEHLQRLEMELTVGLYDSKCKYELSAKNRAIKATYVMTSFLAPRITSDVDLRLAMLRVSQWDVQDAAIKIMKYFHMKERLFGREVCLRPIVFSDLQEDAQESINNGSLCTHDEEGFSARPMFTDVTARWRLRTSQSLAQAMFYMTHIFSRTIRAQQNGVVCVIYTLGTEMAHFRKALAMIRFNALDAMPIRPAGVHICVSHSRFKPILSAIAQAMPKTFLLQWKLHFGSAQECNDELMTYGIPSRMLPGEDIIACDRSVAQETMAKCLQRDHNVLNKFYQGKPKECVEVPPQPKDILLGRGRPYQKYPGNVEFARLLQECKPAYNDPSNTRTERTQLRKQLVQDLRDSGVRFLKRDDSGDWWEEVSDAAARERVSMSLRNMSRK